MATPINRIKIQEKDLTSAGFAAAATDVVYVPGFSALNDQIVFSEPGISPFSKFIDDYTPDTTKVFINAADEISWEFKDGIWSETNTYVEPHPENVPVLCETVQEFETMFGSQPFIFDAPIMYPTYGNSVELLRYEDVVAPGEISSASSTVKDYSIKYNNPETEAKETLTFRLYSVTSDEYATCLDNALQVEVKSDRGEVEGKVNTLDNVGYKFIGTVAFPKDKGFEIYTGTTTISPNEFKPVAGNICGVAWNAQEIVFFIANPSESIDAAITVSSIQRATTQPPITSGSFSAAATSTSAMYKEDTPDLSYIYAKTLIKLGLPVIYENVVVRDNVFPLVEDYEEKIKAAKSVVYSADGLRVVSIDDVVLGTGEKNTISAEMVNNLYNVLAGDKAGFSNLRDKGEYTVKYITSGGYPTFEYDTYGADNRGYNAIAMKMIDVAAERGDAVAIIDHTNKPERPLNAFNTNSVFNALIGGTDGEGSYKITASPEFGTMFTPWALYSGLPISWEVNGVNQNAAVLPASFGYLVALAKSIRTNANWLAIAGAARGQVPYINALNTLERLSNTIADSYQSRDDVASLNAITNIKPYGLTIWGNRTLKDNADKGNLTATSFLNLRNLVSDIKKTLYTTCKSLLFEQNDDILWINFKMKVTPLLDKMQSGAGISGYKLIKGTTTEKAKLVATVKIYPIYAIEEFDVTVEISDQEVSVS